MNEQLAKYFSGESTQDEINLVNSWRSESFDNSKAFNEAKNIWIGLQAIPEPNEDILSKIIGEEPEAKEVKISRNWNWIKYAAAAVIILGIGFAISINLSGEENIEKLSDGSEIVLHGESAINSINITDEMREVRLTGKAYFDVQRDESRPFIIITENARIEVLGTSFVIDAYADKTEVCVESGLVSLVKPGVKGKTDLSVKLTVGEMGTVNNTSPGIIKRNNNNPNYLAWKTKTLTFERSRMSDVKLILEDVYGIDIVFENENLKNCNLTAKFKERRAKDAIEIIAKTFNLTFDMKNEKVTLKGKGC